MYSSSMAWHFCNNNIRDRKKIRRRQKNVSKKICQKDKKYIERAIKLIQNSGTAEGPEILGGHDNNISSFLYWQKLGG